MRRRVRAVGAGRDPGIGKGSGGSRECWGQEGEGRRAEGQRARVLPARPSSRPEPRTPVGSAGRALGAAGPSHGLLPGDPGERPGAAVTVSFSLPCPLAVSLPCPCPSLVLVPPRPLGRVPSCPLAASVPLRPSRAQAAVPFSLRYPSPPSAHHDRLRPGKRGKTLFSSIALDCLSKGVSYREIDFEKRLPVLLA